MKRTKRIIFICPVCGTKKEYPINRQPKFCSVECKNVDIKNRPRTHRTPQLDIEELKRLYIDEQLSSEDIAKIFNTNRTRICRTLKEYNIPRRTAGKGRSIYYTKYPEKNPMYKPEVMKRAVTNAAKTNRNRPKEEKIKTSIKRYATKKRNGTLHSSKNEVAVEKLLKATGKEYEREYIIPEGKERYRYDFYIPATKTLIEVNGTGTHADPEKYKAEDVLKFDFAGWEPKTAQEIWDYDEAKKEYAQSHGYQIIIIWEREL